MDSRRALVGTIACVVAITACNGSDGGTADLEAELEAANQRIETLETELEEARSDLGVAAVETTSVMSAGDADTAGAATVPPPTEATMPPPTDVVAPTVVPTAAPTTVQPVELVGPVSPDGSDYVGSFGDVAAINLPDGAGDQVGVIAEAAGLDRSGSLPVIVRNNTDSAVSGIEVTGRARLDGELAATGSSQGFEPAIVEPGEVAFGYVYFDFDATLEGAEFELTVSSDDGVGFKRPAVIEEVTATGDAIVGIVSNQGDTPVSGPVSVSAACFDSTGNFSGHASSYTDEDEVAANGGTASFSIDLYDDNVSCDIGLVAASGYDF